MAKAADSSSLFNISPLGDVWYNYWRKQCRAGGEDELKEKIWSYLAQYGVYGLFLGLILEFLGIPFPGEAALMLAGFWASRNQFSLFTVLGAAWAGSACGSLLAYLLGRYLGHPFLFRFGRYVFITPRKIVWVRRWFRRYRGATLLLGRFVPGVRPLSAYVAGITRMPFLLFLPLSLLGALLWCATFILVGYLVGGSGLLGG